MDLFENLVNEALFTDGASKDWQDFIKKYEDKADSKNLFVNFSDYGSSHEDKRFVGDLAFSGKPEPSKVQVPYWMSDKKRKGLQKFQPDLSLWTKPFHGDPIGVYTFPIKFVLDAPNEVPYGNRMRFLRVIRSKPGSKVLELQDISNREEVIQLCKKAGCFDDSFTVKDYESFYKLAHDEFINRARPVEGGRKQATPGQVFFYLMQHECKKSVRFNTNEYDLDTQLDNKAQTKRFKKLGIQIISDNADDTQNAIIHPNEPKQAIFIDRSAFEIIDVFEIKRENGKFSREGFVPGTFERRMARAIAERMNDSIKGFKQAQGGIEGESAEFINVGYYNTFITTKGRLITANTRFGADITVGHGKNVPIEGDVEIKGENGYYKSKLKVEESLKDFVDRFVKEYKQQPTDENWVGAKKIPHQENIPDYYQYDLPEGIKKDNKIYHKEFLEFYQSTVNNIKDLLAKNGWVWHPPKEKDDILEAVYAANKIWNAIHQFNTYKITGEKNDFTRLKKYTIYYDEEKDQKLKEKPWYNSLINGLIFIFENEKTPRIGAYPNYNTHIGHAIKKLPNESSPNKLPTNELPKTSNIDNIKF